MAIPAKIRERLQKIANFTAGFCYETSVVA